MNRDEVKKILKRIDETSSIDLDNEIESRFYKIYNGLLFLEHFPMAKKHGSILKLTNKGKELIKNE